MVQVPLEGSLGSNCFTRIIGAFGMDAATAQTGYSGIVKRQGVMNGIAHELM